MSDPRRAGQTLVQNLAEEASPLFHSSRDGLETKSISEATANSHKLWKWSARLAVQSYIFHPVGKSTFIIAQDYGKDIVSP